MRQDTIYGSALIGSTVVLLAMGMTHPTGGQLFASADAMGHVLVVNKFAHTLAMVGVWLALWGFVGLSRRLGWDRPEVLGALAAFALVTIGMIMAATLDGFVIPQIVRGWFEMDEATRAEARQFMRFCVQVASALTRVYMFGAALAIALWSWAAWRTGLSRALGWIGAAVALVGVAAAIGGPPVVSVHELLLLVLGQSVWIVWAGVVLLRKTGKTGTVPVS
jgi:hypothetical protein